MRSALPIALAVALIAPRAALADGTGDVSGWVSGRRSAEVVLFLDHRTLPAGSRPRPVRLGQRGMRFRPELLVVGVGGEVVFPNDDVVSHNVFSVSRVKAFDLGLYRAGESRSVVFDRPGVVDVFCSIHENMHAMIVVVPSHWFTVARPDGSFSLDRVPAGAHELVAWRRGREVGRVPVTVPRGRRVEVRVSGGARHGG